MVAGMRREDVCARFKGYIVPKESGRYTLFISAPGMTYRLTLDGKTYFDSIGGAAISSKERVEVELQAGQRYALELACVRRSMWSTFHFGWELSALAEKELETALEIARRSDVVVLCMGFTDKTEGEGFDRSFKLPKGADEFIVKVAEANPRTVLLVAAGGNVDMSAWIDRVAGLLYVWYPGQEGGLAAAEILFGEVNPSAKLPATFERRLEDRSSFACYADDDNDKRVELTDGIFGGYRHFDGHGIEPRFPFGFGLSYTTFAYANLELSRSTFRDGETVVASFDLENTGSRAGAEVAQLYVRDAKSRLPRPLKELKGFAKVKLEPGERTRVSIELDRSAFTYYDPDCHAFVFEPGEFEIMVGSSATDIELHARCTAE
jgi:beta-glucosidase